MTINIFIIQESTHNNNKHFSCQLNCISWYTKRCIVVVIFVLYMKVYFCYTRQCIIKIFVVIIHRLMRKIILYNKNNLLYILIHRK